MKASLPSIPCRGAAILCALAIAVLTLLPKAPEPPAPGGALAATTGMAAAGLLLLAAAAPALLRALGGRPRAAPRRPSRRLAVVGLVLCAAGLALVASAGLAAEAVRGTGPDGLAGWLNLVSAERILVLPRIA